jgi:ribosomal protein S18 acetylase RimI-like enzyme
MTVEISSAVKEDAARLAYIQKETWLATYPNEEYGISREDIESRDLGSNRRVTQWEEAISKNGTDRNTFVARQDGEIMGYCVAKKEETNNRIAAIYVLPGQQGQGIGKQLMLAAMDWLGKEKDIVLDVATYNAPSIAFYKHLGFVFTGKEAKFGEGWFADKAKHIPESEMLLSRSTAP